jgi:hypothetical protein
MLITKKNPATSIPNANVHIPIIQPGKDCMTTTHAITLLLKKLLPDVRLAH